MGFLINGIFEVTGGIFDAAYVNRKIFPIAGTAFCATIAGHAPDIVRLGGFLAARTNSPGTWIL